MHVKKLFALGGATIAVILAPSAALAAGGSKVTVRVEGLSRTLLAPTTVQTHSGWITKDGIPRGKCPETSGAGALDVATHRKWAGTYDQFGLEVTSIFGETHTFSSKYFWEIFVNNEAASKGACSQKLHKGVQLLFAAVPQKGTEYPMAIQAPRSATTGHRFNVKVVWFNAKGQAKPLAGAVVSVRGKTVKTKGRGTVAMTWSSPGTVVIHASRPGYIRAAAVRVKVAS
jgi:hypothetical protein